MSATNSGVFKLQGQGWKSDIHEAVWTGNIAQIETLLSNGASLEATELDMQPLNLSVIKENVEVAKLLLSRGASVDGGETPALFTACALEKPRMVELLLQHNASLSTEDKKQKIAAIHITADKGFLEILIRLLEANADPNLRSSEGRMTPLHYAASCGRLPVVKRLIEAKAQVDARNISDNTPLLMACNKGHLETVKELIKAGADLTIHGKPDGLTALHAAVVFGGAEGFVDVAAALIEAGAPINDESIDGQLTPLHCAAAKGHVACVRLLVQSKANVHAVDKFVSTPLRIAASNANSLEDLSKFRAVADILISAGADINCTSAAGNTPLHSIVKTGDLELIKWMLSKGASPYKTNQEGVSAVNMAKSEEVRKLLLETPPAQGEVVPPTAASGAAPAATAPRQHASANTDEEPQLFDKKNWQPDHEAQTCSACSSAFTFTNRRHHCRVCGKVFCSKCSDHEIQFKSQKKPTRTCASCYSAYKR